MNERVSKLLSEMHRIETELRDEVLQASKPSKLMAKARELETTWRAEEFALKTSLLEYLRRAQISSILTAPIIYSMFIPLLLLDLWATFFQQVCFRAYGISRVRRADFVVIDRQYLPYLNTLEKLNCIYCGYGNGVIAYVREIASMTEQYWCPIKHARASLGLHHRHQSFAPYGDAAAYRDNLDRLRAELKEPEKTESNQEYKR